MCRKTVRTKSRRGGKSRLSRRSAASTPPPVASPSFSDQVRIHFSFFLAMEPFSFSSRKASRFVVPLLFATETEL